jgi:hypothetical protein
MAATVTADAVPRALERRFTRAAYAVRAWRLHYAAVRAVKAARRGELPVDEARAAVERAQAAVDAFVEFSQVAGFPLKMARRIRPGREGR